MSLDEPTPSIQSWQRSEHLADVDLSGKHLVVGIETKIERATVILNADLLVDVRSVAIDWEGLAIVGVVDQLPGILARAEVVARSRDEHRKS